jgi:hypothetical protein
MSSHTKHIWLLSILFFFAVLSTVLWYMELNQKTPAVHVETTEERLIRESQPGNPIVISPEDQARIIQESKAKSATTTISAKDEARLQAESKAVGN